MADIRMIPYSKQMQNSSCQSCDKNPFVFLTADIKKGCSIAQMSEKKQMESASMTGLVDDHLQVLILMDIALAL